MPNVQGEQMAETVTKNRKRQLLAIGSGMFKISISWFFI